MDSIAVIRPSMAVTDINKPALSPFGALSHALAEEILARTGQTEGAYLYAPMELLAEPRPRDTAGRAGTTVNVKLDLTIEAPSEKSASERMRAAERIGERIIRIYRRLMLPRTPSGAGAKRPLNGGDLLRTVSRHSAVPVTVVARGGIAAPGAVALMSREFTEKLRTLREEGLPWSRAGDIYVEKLIAALGPEIAGNRSEPELAIRYDDAADKAAGRTAGQTGGKIARELESKLTKALSRAAVGEKITSAPPVELLYDKARPEREAAPAEEAEPGNADSGYFGSLPEWAQRFLREGPGDTGVLRKFTAREAPLPETRPGPTAGTVEWTSPSLGRLPADTQLKELRPPDYKEPESTRISDAELRRTADKVYRMIEDRIRRERRRLGL